MAHPFIADLGDGDDLRGVFVATGVSLRSFRDPAKGQYLALVLTDRTGSLPARVWESAEAIAKGFREGDVVRVEGRVGSYQGQQQADLTAVERVDPEEVEPSDFVPSSRHDPERILAGIRKIVEEDVSCPYLTRLIERFISSEDITPMLARAPAAKGLHHAYLGGLVEHIAGALLIARAVCRAHKSLDRDLVCAGIVLHDVGKLKELEVTTSIDYGIVGRLIGHVVLGYEWVMAEIATIEGFPEETRRQLGHILLSHHGSFEYGAPVLPITPEAVAVHHIENLDAQAHHALHAVAAARDEGEDFSEYDRIHGRYYYARRRQD